MEIDKCLICGLILDTNTVIVKERGIKKFIESSITREDGKENRFNDCTEIKLHKTCRNTYNNPKCIEAEKKKKNESEKVLTNSDIDVFDFQNKCLFCDKDASLEFEEKQYKNPSSSRISVGHVKRLDTKNSILKACYTHDDDWSKQKWKSNDIDPTNWGWKRKRSFLSPTLTLDKPAPDEIMKLISCKCKSTCKDNCTCIRSGLPCTELCVFCTDKVCYGEKNISEEAEYDERFEVEINLEREDIPDKSQEILHETEEEIVTTLATNITNLPTTSKTRNPNIYEWIDMDWNDSSDSDEQVKKQRLS